MRGYGLPRVPDLIEPDRISIHEYALKSIKARLPKYGNIKNSFRNSRAKRETRRIWKKKVRAAYGRELQQLGRESIE